MVSQSAAARSSERGQFGDTLASRFAAKVSGYLTVPPGKGTGMPGEPAPHYYFHRPLSKLLGVFFEAGFALDGLEEPQLDEDTQSAPALTWASMRDIPPVLVARLWLARQ